MARLLFIIAILFALVPLSSGSEADLTIEILTKGIVKENFVLVFSAEEDYKAFRFIAPGEPLSVTSRQGYSLIREGDGTAIEIPVEGGRAEFEALIDGLVEKTEDGKVFRTSFRGLEADTLRVRLILPEGSYLEEGVGAVPAPESITTDGSRIILSWSLEDEGPRELAVFFTSRRSGVPVAAALAGGILFCVGGVAIYWYHRKKRGELLSRVLGEEERKVVVLIREGLDNQKGIASRLGFSKSKMSKVVRKLEEKKVVEKTPFFKTNTLKLKK